MRPPRTMGEVIAWALAAASVASAAIHFSVIGEHFHEAWYFGTFFAVVAWAQLAWAVGIVVRPSRRMFLAGAVLQTVIVVIYFWSRTSGLPIGPEPWQPEAWGLPRRAVAPRSRCSPPPARSTWPTARSTSR